MPGLLFHYSAYNT